MAGLSLMQTRTFIDRLGDLEEEITKVCRASEVIAKNAGKEHASGVGRLKEACDSLKEKQEYLREAKDCLLGFDGFLHAEAGSMREAMANPRVGDAFSRVGERMGSLMAMHVNAMIEETIDGIRRVTSSIKALRDARQEAQRSGSLKESSQALSKVCSAAEKAIAKIMKMDVEPSIPELGDEHMHASDEPEEEEVEMVVEKSAGEVGFHGYSLTAGLPPEFLENIQKKKDEAKDKKDDDKDDDKSDKKAALPPEFLENAQKKKDEAAAKKKDGDKDEDEGKKAHGYDLTAGEMPDFIQKKIDEKADKDDEDEDEKKSSKKAESLVPGNKSKGPKELDEEDQGWVPGHRTTQAPTEDDEKKGGKKKATDGVTINVMVASGDPDKIRESVLAALRKADSKDPDPSMDEDLPGEDTDGEPVVGKSAHGYQLTELADHGYHLTA